VQSTADNAHCQLRYVLPFTGSCLMTYGLWQGAPAAFFVGCVLLIFLLVQGLLLFHAAAGVRLRRRHSPHAVRGEDLRIHVALGNHSLAPLLDAWVSDAVYPSGVVEETMRLGGVVPPRKVFRFEYVCRINKPRGEYEIGPATLTLQDPLGVFVRRKKLPVLTRLRVYPTPGRLQRRIPFLHHPLWRRVGEEVISLSGYAGDFRGPRAYCPGDLLSSIHWKATARYGELTVKEFDGNAATVVALLVDFRRVSLRGLGTHTTHETALGLAASILAEAVERGHVMRTVFIGGSCSYPLEGAGTRYLQLVLTEMVNLRPLWSQSDFTGIASRQVALLPFGSTAVFVLGGLAVSVEAMSRLARDCRMRSLTPVALLFDDRKFLRRDVRHMEQDSHAPPFDEIAAAYRRCGFQVVETDVVGDRREGGSA